MLSKLDASLAALAGFHMGPPLRRSPKKAGGPAASVSPPLLPPSEPCSSAGSSTGTAPPLTWAAANRLPPDPPSSAGGQSEVGQQQSSHLEEEGDWWNGGLTPAAAASLLARQQTALQLAGTCSVPPKDYVQNVRVPAVTSQLGCPASPRTTICGASKRPAPHNSAPVPHAKKAHSTRPYNVFCVKQRPLLPPRLPNAERERRLSLQWKALSAAEKAMYRVQGGDALAHAPAPSTKPALASASSTFQQAAAAAMIWKVTEAETAGPAPDASATIHAPPPSALVGSSHTPALAAPAAPQHLTALPGTHLAPPNHSPAASTLSAIPGLLLLAQLLDRMIEEGGLEELGEEDLETLLGDSALGSP